MISRDAHPQSRYRGQIYAVRFVQVLARPTLTKAAAVVASRQYCRGTISLLQSLPNFFQTGSCAIVV
jgi:hypothetical protein